MQTTERIVRVEEKARAVVYADMYGVEAAAEKFKVHKRTIYRWREYVDPVVIERVTKIAEMATAEWAEKTRAAASAVIAAAADKDIEFMLGGGQLSAGKLRSWAGVMKLSNDAKTMADILKERVRTQVKQAQPGADGKVVNIFGREQCTS